MSRNLLSAFIAAFIGIIWLGYHQYRKLDARLMDITIRLAQIEKLADRDNPEQGDREEVLQRFQILESQITALQNELSAIQKAGMRGQARPQARPILVRKFTSQVNAKTVEARLVAVEGANVTIRRIDGKAFTFPIARLTREDQIYIAEHANSIKPAPSEEAIAEPNSSGGTFGGTFDFDALFDEGGE